MENDASPDRSTIKRLTRHVSRTRIIMSLLLLIAIPIFVVLANRAVSENSAAIMQSFGR